MTVVNYARFARVLSRSVEVATDPAQPGVISAVYNKSAKAPITAFLASMEGVLAAKSASARKNREMREALANIDRPYCVARSAVMAVLPDTVLPGTLKTLATDTEVLDAIERILEVVNENKGELWADELLNGEFGQMAPVVVQALRDATKASSDLGKATTTRIEAFAPAQAAYGKLKRVVRDALGAKSKEYRRIHLRSSGGDGDQGEAGIGQPPPA